MEIELFENDSVALIMRVLKTQIKITGDGSVYKILQRIVDGKLLICFQSETSVFKFPSPTKCGQGIRESNYAVFLFDQLPLRSLISLDKSPPHASHTFPSPPPPQVRKDLRKRNGATSISCPCGELGFRNFIILRCFEILHGPRRLLLLLS